MEFNWLNEAKAGLSRVAEIVHEGDLNDDAVLQELLINSGLTIGNCLVSLASSMKQMADHFDPPFIPPSEDDLGKISAIELREQALARDDEGVFE